MKKILALSLAMVMIFSFGGCNTISPIEEATGATREQAQVMEKILEEAGIAIEVIGEGEVELSGDEETDAFILEISKNFTPYDITTKDGNAYRMTIENEAMTVIAVVDRNTQEYVYGGFIDMAE